MIKFQSGGQNGYFRSPLADYYAKYPEKYTEKLERDRQGRLGQSAIRLGAGALDFFGGRKAQREAEGQIEELGAQAEGIQSQLEGMRAPGSMDPSVVAEATRNAAILGFQSPAEDPSDALAAQAMALESGADPSKLYAAASKQDAASDAQQRAEAQGQFQQGLGLAQQDAMNRFRQDYSQKASELDDINQQLAQAQQESLIAQQRKMRGTQGALAGGMGIASDYRKGDIKNYLDKFKGLMGGKPMDDEPAEDEPMSYNFGDFSRAEGESLPGFGLQSTAFGGPGALQGNFSGISLRNEQADGGSVQQTPGEYDHDTNDMILMAQGKDGMLIDTGIRQTGGEFVIDPFDAGNMRQAHEKIDSLEMEAVRTGRADLRPELVADLMQLYDAVRFINEPQFQDDYYEKKMNGYA